MTASLTALKHRAIAWSLFPPATLRQAVAHLGFVQADPIRSPARAQDLILRHRVKLYRAGDLEAKYPKLGLEEDFLYAYGFMPFSTWELLHPRKKEGLGRLEQRVLEIVSSAKYLHPRDLEIHLGRERSVNAWGGYSKSTTRALQALHYRGLLRIAKRENGIRLYEATSPMESPYSPEQRLKKLTLLVARIFAPAPERGLRATLRLLNRWSPIEGSLGIVKQLLASGELESVEVDGVRYLWPAEHTPRRPIAPTVRFLAPFDPLVWDRARFAHFWGWDYRFEAYTPPSKRLRGYYAMPLLWGSEVVGWANISRVAEELNVETGFAARKPAGPAFRLAFEEEVERMRSFLSRDANIARPTTP